MDEFGLGLSLNDSRISEVDLVKKQISDKEVGSQVNKIPPVTLNDVLVFLKQLKNVQ